jgi:hypothetical protein
MKEMMLWGWWYGVLLTVPLFATGIAMKARMRRAVAQVRKCPSINL